MTPDFVVVGAGIVGCSVAYELAKRGRRVIVVERGEIGREASWAAGGVLTPVHLADYPTPLAELCVRAQEMYPAFVEELGVDVELRRTGMLVLVRDDEDAKAAAVLPPHEKTADGFLLPDVMQVRNHRLVRAIAAAATKRGVEFRAHSEVTGFLRVPGRVNGVRTAQGDIQAGTTVIAAGAWSGVEAAKLGIDLPVRPVKGQILLTQGSIPHILLHREQYLIPRADGKILIGSTLEEAGFDKSVTVGGAQFLLRRAAEIWPALEGAPILGMWAGLRPATPDRMPVIGPAEGWEGLFFATGHYRNGILLGPLTGVMVADYLAN